MSEGGQQTISHGGDVSSSSDTDTVNNGDLTAARRSICATEAEARERTHGIAAAES